MRFAFVVLLAAPLAAQAPAFTIEQALGAPFPTELTAAPAKGRIAWVFNARGRRNVWVAEPGADGGYAARAVTSYTEDDGQELGELAWSPDGETIVYARGSLGPGSRTNPLSLPSGDLGQELYAVSVHGGAPKKLGDGHGASVSPKGDIVAYESGGHIWAAHLDGSGKAESLISEKGRSGSLRWSPDGSKLAFVSARGDHDFVGVYDVAAKSVVWLAPSVDRDGDPEWSPDGTHLAFVRVPTGGPAFFLEGRTGRPWSIWVADAATGVGHQVWAADQGSGSLYQQLVADRQLFWSAGDRIVFPWEKSGWLHLYSIAARGGAATELTPGDFEIFTASMNPNRQDIVYAGNESDIDRQHVWRVAVSGGRPAELTPGTGIESYPVVASDGKTVAVLRSDARRPMHPAIVTSTVHDLAADAIPADFPAAKLVVPEQVVFSSGDGIAIHGQLFVPAGAGRHPAVVFFHGGPIRQMLLGWHMMDAYSYMYAMNQYLASRGFVVLSVNYRGGIGYGLNFRKPANFGANGASENQDIQGAGLYLRSRADVDAAHIGVWGGSYGGLMTAQALSRYSDLFAAGVDYAGVHDWRAFLFAPPFDTTRDEARTAYQSSPMAAVRGWRSPVLIVQADDDRNVPYAQAPELITALRAQNVEFEQMIIPDETHDLLLYRSWIRFFEAAADYLSRHLQGNPGHV
ncbi:MAG TPA: prolyl oligopeptidase family serine peptidase [Gemmatimonadaceae bacterium]|nr:prolyl oligopeptidase family serine peptidase [Gemmatimonadaceae bacterium]